MKYAILATFNGVTWQRSGWETDLTDVVLASESAELEVDVSGVGDTEYGYLAEQVPSSWVDAAMMLEDDDPRLQALIEKASEKFGGSEAFWAFGQQATVTGVLGWEDLERWLSDLGAYFETENTGGSLGGPANPCGWAPDVAFNLESQELVASIRVTPLGLQSEASWHRHVAWLREAV